MLTLFDKKCQHLLYFDLNSVNLCQFRLNLIIEYEMRRCRTNQPYSLSIIMKLNRFAYFI